MSVIKVSKEISVLKSVNLYTCKMTHTSLGTIQIQTSVLIQTTYCIQFQRMQFYMPDLKLFFISHV